MSKIQEAIDFFEYSDTYDKKLVIEDIISRMDEMADVRFEETSIYWDHEYVMDLDYFTEEFYSELIKRVCNALKSFQKEESAAE